MAKGLGIAALIIAIIAMFIPVVSLFVSWLALILAALAALCGDRIFSTTTPIIVAFNTLVLSPMTLVMFANEKGEGWLLENITVALFLAPFVCMFLNWRGVVKLGKSEV